MRLYTFSLRNAKEVIRDPLNICFGLGFPIVLIMLLSAIQANIPVALFEIETLAPGITVFGLEFMTLFAATLTAKDRESALLRRLFTTPLTSFDYICGYIIPIIPFAAAQSAVCYAVAAVIGLDVKINIIYAVISVIPISVFFIAFGVFCGSILGVKQVGGICGALLTNLCAWMSGIWFDLSLVGKTFKRIAYALPFVHAVELEKAILNGSTHGIMQHIVVVLVYTVAAVAAAACAFMYKMEDK